MDLLPDTSDPYLRGTENQVSENLPKSLISTAYSQTVCGMLDHRFHLVGLAKMAILKVNTRQRSLTLANGHLKAVKPGNGFLAVAGGAAGSEAVGPPGVSGGF